MMRAQELPRLDRASLEGLEPLLDKIFQTDFSPENNCDYPTVEVAKKPRGSIIGGDDDVEVVADQTDKLYSTLKTQIAFLEAQLRAANDVTKENSYQIRWLHLQMAEKDAQISLMPGLLDRALQCALFEKQLSHAKADMIDLEQEVFKLRRELDLAKKSIWLKIKDWFLAGA